MTDPISSAELDEIERVARNVAESQLPWQAHNNPGAQVVLRLLGEIERLRRELDDTKDRHDRQVAAVLSRAVRAEAERDVLQYRLDNIEEAPAKVATQASR